MIGRLSKSLLILKRFLQTLIAFGLKNGNFGVVEVTKEDIIVLWQTNASELGRDKRVSILLVRFATFKDSNHIVVIRDDSFI